MSHHMSDYEEIDIEKDEDDFDVVIIGAGLTGLTAANRLTSAGLNILIIEQSDSTGGRLLSNKESESFYAHELQMRLNVMIQNLNLSKKREKFPNNRQVLHLKNNKILNNNLTFYAAAEVYYFIKMMDKASKGINFIMKNEPRDKQLPNISMEYVICKLVFFKKSRSICRNLIYVTCGIDNLEDVSALWYIVMLKGAGGFLQRLRVNIGDSERYYIQGGAMNIARRLTKNINKDSKIQYHESAYKIYFNDDRAHVWTEKKHYKCAYVIVATAPIKSSKLVIKPDLPLNIKKAQSSFAQGKAIFFNGKRSGSYAFNHTVKSIIGVENWKSTLMLAYDASCIKDENFHLAGFLAKTNSDPFENSIFISTLSRYFNNNILFFDDYKEIDCAFISGGGPMCVLKPGNSKTHVNLLAANHGRIFFAISEYASNWPGTIAGAIEAGESAAFSILERSRPQSMNRLEWILHRLKLTANNVNRNTTGS